MQELDAAALLIWQDQPSDAELTAGTLHITHTARSAAHSPKWIAQCSGCSGHFLIDEGDRLTVTACPTCTIPKARRVSGRSLTRNGLICGMGTYDGPSWRVTEPEARTDRLRWYQLLRRVYAGKATITKAWLRFSTFNRWYYTQSSKERTIATIDLCGRCHFSPLTMSVATKDIQLLVRKVGSVHKTTHRKAFVGSYQAVRRYNGKSVTLLCHLVRCRNEAAEAHTACTEALRVAYIEALEELLPTVDEELHRYVTSAMATATTTEGFLWIRKAVGCSG